jgi:hypothetical protein
MDPVLFRTRVVVRPVSRCAEAPPRAASPSAPLKRRPRTTVPRGGAPPPKSSGWIRCQEARPASRRPPSRASWEDYLGSPPARTGAWPFDKKASPPAGRGYPGREALEVDGMGRPVPSNRRLLVSSSSMQAADPLMHLEPICPGARGQADETMAAFRADVADVACPSIGYRSYRGDSL